MPHVTYNPDNIFAKIIRKEIPCRLILENDIALAFYDIAPKAKIHALVIPKGPYCSAQHFYTAAPATEIAAFYAFLSEIINILDLNEAGYRLISNAGEHGRQEVPHFHVHVLGGQPLLSTIG